MKRAAWMNWRKRSPAERRVAGLRHYRLLRAAMSGVLLAGTLVCRSQATPLVVLVTDADGHPLDHAVVAIILKGVPSLAPPGTVADMAQHHRQFVPQLLVVQAGTTVSFPNLDKVRHHVYSLSTVHPFEFKLYSDRPPGTVIFDKEGTATLGCNIHDQMLAWIHVVPTPLFTTTDASGVARLDVPAGNHRLSVWQADVLGEEASLEQDLIVAQQAIQSNVRLVAHNAGNSAIVR